MEQNNFKKLRNIELCYLCKYGFINSKTLVNVCSKCKYILTKIPIEEAIKILTEEEREKM